MPAAGAAALTPLGQGHRGEDEEPGVGIEVPGFAADDGPVVRLLHPVVGHPVFVPTMAYRPTGNS